MHGEHHLDIVPTAEAEADWTRHVHEAAQATLLGAMTDSWLLCLEITLSFGKD